MDIIGITDEQTHCDECGRIELRSTVILGIEGAEAGRYGSHCAAKVLTRENGREYHGGVLDSARTVEAVRRSNVADYFRRALRAARAGDMLTAMRNRADAVALTLIRADEKALNEKLLAWERDFRDCRAGAWGVEDKAPARTHVAGLLASGWTMQGLASRLAVSVSTVRRWARGSVTPLQVNARKLTILLRSGARPA